MGGGWFWDWGARPVRGGVGGGEAPRRRRIKMMPRPVRPRTAIPPTTPPTIAPVGVDEPPLPVGAGVEVEVEEVLTEAVDVVDELESVPDVDGLVLDDVDGSSLEPSLRTVVRNARPSVSPSYVVRAN